MKAKPFHVHCTSCKLPIVVGDWYVLDFFAKHWCMDCLVRRRELNHYIFGTMKVADWRYQREDQCSASTATSESAPEVGASAGAATTPKASETGTPG